jgi:hypothetical protein
MPPPAKRPTKSALAAYWGQAASPPASTKTASSTLNLASDSEADDEEPTAKKRKRIGASYIWDHGSEVSCSDGSRGWKCTHCRRVLSYTSTTTNQRSHLRTQHGIPDPQESNSDKQQTTLDTHILRPFKVEVVQKLLVEYHIERRAPFRAIESPAL